LEGGVTPLFFFWGPLGKVRPLRQAPDHQSEGKLMTLKILKILKLVYPHYSNQSFLTLTESQADVQREQSSCAFHSALLNFLLKIKASRSALRRDGIEMNISNIH
jgi:hypothetical protein